MITGSIFCVMDFEITSVQLAASLKADLCVRMTAQTLSQPSVTYMPTYPSHAGFLAERCPVRNT